MAEIAVALQLQLCVAQGDSEPAVSKLDLAPRRGAGHIAGASEANPRNCGIGMKSPGGGDFA
ncbi:MAG: hypothetical protein H6Q07_2188 [Acidobacteria bacterium]|nr:hypothetical protein [Acidobacteriota bacterium]